MMVTILSSAEEINWKAVGTGQIRNCVLALLKTRLGEIPFNRGVGIDTDYIDTPMKDAMGAITNDVMEIIDVFEPRAKVKDIVVEMVNDNGDMEIKVVAEL